MKRTHIAVFAGIVATTLLLGSCDALFTNQFKEFGLGQVTSQVLVDAIDQGDIDAIVSQSGLEQGEVSKSFIAAATQSEEVATQVVNALVAAINDPTTPPATVQASQALVIEIKLEMSGANNLIRNIVTAVAEIDFANFNPLANTEDLTNLLRALFPPRDPKAIPDGWTEDEIADLIDEIVALNGDLTAIGEHMEEYGQLIVGIDAGWFAQVGTIVSILNQVTPLAPYTTTGEAIASIIADPTDPGSKIEISDTILDDVSGDTALQALFAAAGWNLADLIAMFD
jgi:hypothetical protein